MYNNQIKLAIPCPPVAFYCLLPAVYCLTPLPDLFQDDAEEEGGSGDKINALSFSDSATLQRGEALCGRAMLRYYTEVLIEGKKQRWKLLRDRLC